MSEILQRGAKTAVEKRAASQAPRWDAAQAICDERTKLLEEAEPLLLQAAALLRRVGDLGRDAMYEAPSTSGYLTHGISDFLRMRVAASTDLAMLMRGKSQTLEHLRRELEVQTLQIMERRPS